MGEYFQQVIMPKFGIDAHLRMDDETIPRTRNLADVGIFKQLWNGFKAYERGRYVSMTLGDMFCRSGEFKKFNVKVDKSKKETHRKYETTEIEGKGEDIKEFMDAECKKGEVISGFTYSSARGLAKAAAYLANNGSFKGEQLLSEATWEEMHSEPKFEVMCPIGDKSLFTKGGFAYFDEDEYKKYEKNEFWSSNPFA